MSLKEIAVGSIFASRYRILRSVKLGSSSAVYAAEEVEGGKAVCLKLLDPELVREPALRQRFVEHMMSSARIESAHVVSPLEAAVEAGSGIPYYLMELLPGKDLDGALKPREPLPRADAERILAEIGEGLGKAHEIDLFHGNLKPQNIFLADGEGGAPPVARILNFGVAKVTAEGRAGDAGAMATPAWMAPEQASPNEVIGPQTDIWAYGLLAFRLLTGYIYWQAGNQRGASPMALLREVTVDEPVPASKRAKEYAVTEELPAGFDEWFARCLERDPAARFANATEAHRELAEVLAGRGVAKRPQPARRETKNRIPAISSPGVPSSGGPPSGERPPRATGQHQPMPPPPRPRRWVRALLLLLLCLGAVLAGAGALYWRLKLRHGLNGGALCDALATSKEELLQRRDACSRSCDAGVARHCRQLGRLVLQHQLDDAGSGKRAASAYLRACDQKDGESCRLLGMMYWEGNGVPEEHGRSIELLMRACDAGDTAGCAQLAEAVLGPARPKEKNERALQLLEQACAKKQVGPCGQLGRAYLADAGGKDARRGVELTVRACELEDVASCARAGAAYAQGRGVEKDELKARRYLELACQKEIDGSCLGLARLIIKDPGSSDLQRAATMLDKECSARSGEACYHLGQMYLSGRGVKRDRHRAMSLLEQGCTLGHQASCSEKEQQERPDRTPPRGPAPEVRKLQSACMDGDGASCLKLATLLERGQGTSRDLRRARALFERACSYGVAEGCIATNRMGEDTPHGPAGRWPGCDPERGCWPDDSARPPAGRSMCGTATTCLSMGYMLREGAGVRRDPRRAADAFKIACEQGNAEGCAALASLYAQGEGVQRDPRRAQELLRKACQWGFRDACNPLDRPKQGPGGLDKLPQDLFPPPRAPDGVRGTQI